MHVSASYCDRNSSVNGKYEHLSGMRHWSGKNKASHGLDIKQMPTASLHPTIRLSILLWYPPFGAFHSKTGTGTGCIVETEQVHGRICRLISYLRRQHQIMMPRDIQTTDCGSLCGVRDAGSKPQSLYLRPRNEKRE